MSAPTHPIGYGDSPYLSNQVAASTSTSNLRRRSTATPHTEYSSATGLPSARGSAPSSKTFVKKLDFMYPKVESEFTAVQTDRGGMTTVLCYALICLLALAEIASHWSFQNQTVEHIKVDTALGKKLKVNLNITFPALACVDLHVDAMDAAGDSQFAVDEHTFVKIQLHTDGTKRTQEEITVDMNAARKKQAERDAILATFVPENYCGPCYGAMDEAEGGKTGDEEMDGPQACCQTCKDLEKAYKRKGWRTDLLFLTSEQCIREGRDQTQKPKKMTSGQGCNLSGYMTVNRVAGNFHIAMGEGLERDGHHIHSFLPEDTPNFNASHIIHEMSFGPLLEGDAPLNGVTKIVTEEMGTTGLFQYFIKVVPTTYTDIKYPTGTSNTLEGNSTSGGLVETNRYFFTERFRPLMTDVDDNKDGRVYNEITKKVELKTGGGPGHHQPGHHEHHKHQNALLPGIFFMYEIYPFAVEVSTTSVPFTHLLVRLLATVGGVFTFFKWVHSLMEIRDKKRGRSRY